MAPAAQHAGRWCVVQEPIDKALFGTAVIAGVSIAWIDLADAADTLVEIQAASTVLKSGTSGTGQILWVKGGVGSADATGPQWAIIRLPTGGGGGESLGTVQYQVHMMLTDLTGGWDWVQANPLGS